MAAQPDTSAPSPTARSIGTTTYDRVPPHNLNAEISVLGSMLLSRNAVADISDIVKPEDFYRGAHRTIFDAASDLYNRGEPLDTVTLADELERRGRLDDVGGVVALTGIVQQVPTSANALYYARIVAEHALRRRLIDAGTTVTKLGYEPEAGVDEALDSAEQVIFDVAQRGRTGDIKPIKPLLHDSFELLERLSENKTGITGLPTGFTDFDDLTAGLQPGNLVIVAARPAMGKSTMVTNMASHVTVESRMPVALFSLEMSAEELVMRLLSAESRVNLEKLRTGRLEDPDWAKLSQAMGRLAEAPLFIDDTAGINLMEIRSKCRRLKQKHGLSLVIVDYLQLMQSHRRVENRVQEVSELSRGLKILAKELSVPVIALSQLSRKPEDRARDDRRPQLADLRESGCVTGDTLVALASGATVPIRELVGTTPEVVTLDGWQSTTARASKVWLTGRKQVFRLTTRSGRVVRASANHPLRKLDGWYALEDIAIGDRVAIPFGRFGSEPSIREASGPVVGGGLALAEAPATSLLDHELKEITTEDVFWDTVVDIQPEGVEDVFDMTVPGTHSFVGNGIFLHNSIEQDADLVAFIYRDEVYDPDSPAKGEAELIVAKHRNGPLRTIRLSFLGHHSRFANMARSGVSGGGPL